MPRPLTYGRVRLYESLRSAHLERFHALEPASVLYAGTRYDFDGDLTSGLDIHHVTSLSQLFLRLVCSRVRELEINEPLMLSANKISLVAITAIWMRSAITRKPVRIVSYAIENLDPFQPDQPRARRPLQRRLFRWTTRALLRRVDRLALGTPSAYRLYEPHLRHLGGRARLIPALPARCSACALPDTRTTGKKVLFLGRFDDRKGIAKVCDAWPLVRQRTPATLEILGDGPLLHLALALSDEYPEVQATVSPSRDDIHRALSTATVLVLPSQPALHWREQVGLPIVEGLAHGCEIVTTDQTGIADWLKANGHHVISTTECSPSRLADEILDALDRQRPASSILMDLPGEDGRLAADRWMFARDRDAAGEQLRTAAERPSSSGALR